MAPARWAWRWPRCRGRAGRRPRAGARDAARGRCPARRAGLPPVGVVARPHRAGGAAALRRGDDHGPRVRAAGAAETVRGRAVEVQGVAFGEGVDGAVEVGLERSPRHVDRDLAVLDLVLGGPAAAAGGPLAQDRRTRGAAELAQAVLV